MKVVLWYTQIHMLYCRIFDTYAELNTYVKTYHILNYKTKVVPNDHCYFEHDGV